MSAVYYERPPDPTGVSLTGGGNINAQLEVPYIVFGASSELDAHDCVASSAAADRSGLVRVDWTIDEVADGTYTGAVRYVPATMAPPPPPPATNDDEFEFDTTGFMSRTTYGQELSVTFPEGEGPPSFTFGGAIGVSRNGKHVAVEGCEVGIQQFDFSITLYLPDEALSEEYLAVLYNQSWTVNDDDVAMLVQGRVLRFKEGELLFMGCSGRKRRGVGDWPLTMKFRGIPNKINLPIGPKDDPVIVVPEKKGHDYLWVQFEDDEAASFFLKRPLCAVVDEVYDRSDFANLNVPTPPP